MLRHAETRIWRNLRRAITPANNANRRPSECFSRKFLLGLAFYLRETNSWRMGKTCRECFARCRKQTISSLLVPQSGLKHKDGEYTPLFSHRHQNKCLIPISELRNSSIALLPFRVRPSLLEYSGVEGSSSLKKWSFRFKAALLVLLCVVACKEEWPYTLAYLSSGMTPWPQLRPIFRASSSQDEGMYHVAKNPRGFSDLFRIGVLR